MYIKDKRQKTMAYHKGKVYKMCSEIDNKIYIGSTIQFLKKRFDSHKNKAKTGTSIVYIHFNIIEWHNVKIELIEEYPCANKKELVKREQHYIDLLKPELNTLSAYTFCPHNKTHCRCVSCNPGSFMCHVCKKELAGNVNLSRHFNSKKHLKNVEALNISEEEKKD
jgi:group I intron endonuclease